MKLRPDVLLVILALSLISVITITFIGLLIYKGRSVDNSLVGLANLCAGGLVGLLAKTSSNNSDESSTITKTTESVTSKKD